MAVGGDDMPAEGPELLPQIAAVQDVPDQVCSLGPVGVQDTDQVRHFIAGRRHGGLPDLTLSGLSVAYQTVDLLTGAV